MNCLEQLLSETYKESQYKFRIAAITTMSCSGFHGKTHLQIIKEDISYIKSLIENGWCVLGWKNQITSPNYAIGGGIANF